MKKLAIIFCLLASQAFAQQQQTPKEQALAQRVGSEIGANIEANAIIIDLRQQLATAQARVKALEEKYEPKKDAEPAK